MAFILNFFAVSILLCHMGLQSIHSKQVTFYANTEDDSKFQVTDDNASVSAKDFVTFSGQSNETDEGGHSVQLVTGTPFEWSEENATKEEVEIKEKSSNFSTQSADSTVHNSESTTIFTYVEEKIDETMKKAVNSDLTISLSEETTLTIGANSTELIDQQNYTLPEISNTTVFSEEYNTIESSRDPHLYSPLPNKEQEELLMVLKSNCSIINSEIITLNEDLINVDCTIYLRVNFSSENGTQDKILNILEKLTVKPSDLQIVKTKNQEESVYINKQKNALHGLILDQETFAYLAVALSFVFLLLLAVIVFGVRCLRKQRPSLDISHFDVKLSNYTLTKIPRVSLSSLDCLQDTDCLDDKSEPPAMGSRKCESSTNLDSVTHDTYSSDREMKTFGVARSINSRSGVSNNVEPRSHLYTDRSPIAYENHTFQRYF